ncbi:MAG: RNA-binding transcriptional accessory protein [Deltaproteobacteria bacterium]|nr:RNA-binding transcriptional accessory protein [Deltaproteobacteria bacterium]
MDLKQLLSEEFQLRDWQVDNVIALLDDRATIPFIARYRKEATGELNEVILRELSDRYEYLKEIEERKQTVLKTISELGKLTDDLKQKIEGCLEKSKLEDLYLPYKPKKRTRASVAKEKGLEPLLEWILSLSDPYAGLEAEAQKYVDLEKGVSSAIEALKGAADIFAERIAEKAEYRDLVRANFLTKGLFVSKVKKDMETQKTKFEMYYDYRVPVKEIKSHNMLAVRRAEKEGVVAFKIEADEDEIIGAISSREIKIGDGPVADFLKSTIKDAYDRLVKVSISAEVRLTKKKEADLEAIKTFETNLRELLLAAPAGSVRVFGVDPGFRTGCKVAMLDETANMLGYITLHLHKSQREEDQAKENLLKLINTHHPRFIAIGNGTASRETDKFIKQVVKELDADDKPHVLVVSESGASVYSASECAIHEFPDLDVTIRGAVSIGRRLVDPLAEMVKIDPKSLGVGQYQHDVDQNLLKKKLEEVVESCVNYVGVNLNTASAELLSYVSGLTMGNAQKVVKHRQESGPFKNRKMLLDVGGIGAKTFEQAAGFLRIKGGDNPLDDSAVHPESYYVVEKMAQKLNIPVTSLIANDTVLSSLRAEDYVNEKTGIATIKDILDELRKPGRDPRATFSYADFREDVTEVTDLKEGMILEGVVTNVTNFGAFVDIGVHRDGLVHVSQLAEKFVSDPAMVVKMGDRVKVKVLTVDQDLGRISLSMRLDASKTERRSDAPKPERRSDASKAERGPQRIAPTPVKKMATLEDLVRKFNR